MPRTLRSKSKPAVDQDQIPTVRPPRAPSSDPRKLPVPREHAPSPGLATLARELMLAEADEALDRSRPAPSSTRGARARRGR